MPPPAALLSLLTCVCFLTHILATNLQFAFSQCDDHTTHVVTGALLESHSKESRINCTLRFQAAAPDIHFLVQLTLSPLSPGSVAMETQCANMLTLRDYYTQDRRQSAGEYVYDLCHSDSDKFFTEGAHLSITWEKGRSLGEERGFSIVLTSLPDKSAPCDSSTHLRCRDDHCIPLSLRCDGIPHCYTADDESLCAARQEVSNITVSTPPPPTTTPPPGSTAEVYLWLPLIVVVLFTGVMVTLILIGRKSEAETTQGTSAVIPPSSLPPSTPPFSDPSFTRTEVIYMALMACVFCLIVVVCLVIGKRGSQRGGEEISTLNTSEAAALTDERNGLRVDVNGNPNYEPEPGMPSTPPPSYSVIERQTSYVSHISVSSSQMSEPPDYNDALELPGDPNAPSSRVGRSGRHSSRRRPRRSYSGGSTASRFTRLRQRIFSRSVSAQEGRYRPRSSTSSISEADHTSDAARISELSDIVFEDESSPPSPHRGDQLAHSTPHPSSNQSAADVFRSVSQVTAATSIGSSESEESQNTPVPPTDIFAQIHSLNESGGATGGAGGTSPTDRQTDGQADTHTETSLSSEGANVSEMALLAHQTDTGGQHRPTFF